MRGQPFNLEAYLTKARMAIQDGRMDEGIEELRRGILDAARVGGRGGRGHVENILRFAQENDVFDEVEETLDDEPLRRAIFGPE